MSHCYILYNAQFNQHAHRNEAICKRDEVRSERFDYNDLIIIGMFWCLHSRIVETLDTQFKRIILNTGPENIEF